MEPNGFALEQPVESSIVPKELMPVISPKPYRMPLLIPVDLAKDIR
jgi:hypothetical protein